MSETNLTKLSDYALGILSSYCGTSSGHTANCTADAPATKANKNNEGKIVFFSGGTALTETSRVLARYGLPAVHLITPFDSGGSSAVLRQAFNMPAVGDLRNRILNLARLDVVGQALPALSAMRLSKDDSPAQLKAQLHLLASGEHAAIRKLEPEIRERVAVNFAKIMDQLPSNFDLRGASIGNLLLVGAYLRLGRDLNAAVKEFSDLLQIVGVVRPIVVQNLHLAAQLANGQILLGQHLITGKEVPELLEPISDLYLTDAKPCVMPNPQAGYSLEGYWAESKPPTTQEAEQLLAQASQKIREEPTTPTLRPENFEAFIGENVTNYIQQASCICYPMGSFYSSLIANLLPRGVGKAVAKANCPKVYIPSAGHDPETASLNLPNRIRTLFAFLRRDAGEHTPAHQLLTHVLVDANNAPNKSERAEINKLGVSLAEIPLINKKYSTTNYSPYLLLNGLAELLTIEA